MVAAIRALFVNVRFDTVRLLVSDSIIAPESPQALLAVHGAFMSEILDCDPDRGFVAFPVALFDLDLSPGAFRTLAELCRMANTSGQCWPSLAQLGRRLGRSRASISAYIVELRNAGVLSTEEQKMANGYNYRLRYTVTFWKEWRAGLGKAQTSKPRIKSLEKPERRVQPAERPLRTKNHIHINQQGSEELKEILMQWKGCVGQAPYPAFTSWPSNQLLESTKKMTAAKPKEVPIISADIEAALGDFIVERNLVGDSATLALQVAPLLTCAATLQFLMSELEAQWQPHWRKAPNLYQISRIVKGLPPIHSEGAQHKLLKSYLQRWKLHLRSLPSVALRSKVAA